MDKMYSIMRGTTTYKYNHDNIHETIIEHYKYLTDLKNEVIEMLESDLNEILDFNKIYTFDDYLDVLKEIDMRRKFPNPNDIYLK